MIEFMNYGEAFDQEGIPEAIQMRIEMNLLTLDQEYGATRKLLDDGGYVVYLSDWSRDYGILQNRHSLFSTEFSPEFTDEIIVGDKRYISSLYLLNNDYGVIILGEKEIFPKDSYQGHHANIDRILSEEDCRREFEDVLDAYGIKNKGGEDESWRIDSWWVLTLDSFSPEFLTEDGTLTKQLHRAYKFSSESEAAEHLKLIKEDEDRLISASTLIPSEIVLKMLRKRGNK
jgi:hypothetical protein